MFEIGDKVTSISLGGASYNDTKLNVNGSALKISPSLKSYLFEFYLQALTWGAFIFMVSIVWGDKSTDAETFIKGVSIFCISFSAIVRFIFSKIRKKHNFDKQLGVYYSGKTPNPKLETKLSEIKKLYLISKEIYSSNKSYTCFELSFYTEKGNRVMIMNHGDRYEIFKDAEILSEFLGVRCEKLRKGEVYECA